MKFTLSFWSLVFFIAACHGLALAPVLFSHRRGNRSSNALLGVLVLIVALILAEYLMVQNGHCLTDERGFVIFLSTPLFFLIGPVYYLYAASLLSGNRRARPRELWHLLPAALCLLNHSPLYLRLLSWPPSVGGAVPRSSLIWLSGYLYMGVQIVQTAIYLYLAHRRLSQLESTLKHNCSNSSLLNAVWLKKLTAVLLVVVAGHLGALGFLVFQTHVAAVEYLMALTLSAVIYAVGYVSIRQPEIISGSLVGAEREAKSNGDAAKYQKSSLSPQQRQALRNRLLQTMEREKPYLNCDLSLPELARQVALSPNQLSQVLNQELRLTFFDFVNQYRVQEAQHKLLDPGCRHLTTLAIAFEAGFNSKTSFNRIFKKYTGLPPSQYVKSRQHATV